MRSTWMIASAPGAIGAPVMVRIAVSRTHTTSRHRSRADGLEHLEADRIGFAGGRDIGSADRVAVHRGIVEARNIARRADLLGEHSAEPVKDRNALDAERSNGFEDDAQSVVGTNHLIGNNTRLRIA